MTGLSNHDFAADDATGAAIGPPRYRLRPPPSDDPEAVSPQIGSSLPRHFLVLALRTMLEMQRQSTKIIADLHEQNGGSGRSWGNEDPRQGVETAHLTPTVPRGTSEIA
jgi:hypothetical protein